jgi:hypothetical protein
MVSPRIVSHFATWVQPENLTYLVPAIFDRWHNGLVDGRMTKKRGLQYARPSGISMPETMLLQSFLLPFLAVSPWFALRSCIFPLGKLLAHCRADRIHALTLVGM